MLLSFLYVWLFHPKVHSELILVEFLIRCFLEVCSVVFKSLWKCVLILVLLPCSILQCLDGVSEVLFVLTNVDYKSNCIFSWDWLASEVLCRAIHSLWFHMLCSGCIRPVLFASNWLVIAVLTYCMWRATDFKVAKE